MKMNYKTKSQCSVVLSLNARCPDVGSTVRAGAQGIERDSFILPQPQPQPLHTHLVTWPKKINELVCLSKYMAKIKNRFETPKRAK